MTTTINSPIGITADGNIVAHRRGGWAQSFTWQDSDGADLDVSASTMFFEIDGICRIELTAGATDAELLLEVPEANIAEIPAGGALFALIDETGDPHVTLWAGMIQAIGHATEPSA